MSKNSTPTQRNYWDHVLEAIARWKAEQTAQLTQTNVSNIVAPEKTTWNTRDTQAR